MLKVLVVSDGHGEITDIEEIKAKEKPDITICAGDFCFEQSTANELFDYYVRGNNDFVGEEEIVITLEKLTIMVTHGADCFSCNRDGWLQNLRNMAKENNAKLLIFGHSHKFYFEQGEPALLNPGSIAFPRNINRKKSYAILQIDQEKFKVFEKYI